ncbi:hypothetical protein [Paraburkholderia youngii]|uniref:hypothetical protein n=1 Tax=Paraburkholderia youngii TaxID=2782701 RepID=UPI003D231A26
MANRYARLKRRCAGASISCPSPVAYTSRLIDRAAKLAVNNIAFRERNLCIVNRMPYASQREIAAVLLSCRLLPHWSGSPRAPTLAAEFFRALPTVRMLPSAFVHNECLSVH